MAKFPILPATLARLFATLVLIGPPIIFVVIGMWLSQQLSIDRCLDRGGRWDHASSTCDTGKLHAEGAGKIE